jgi:poly(A) polymerase
MHTVFLAASNFFRLTPDSGAFHLARVAGDVRHSSMTARETALEIVKRIQDAGHAAFWVGGCVRDLLLGREPGDYDVATSARPEEIEAIFQRTVPVGRQFGVLLVVENGKAIEVATFRSEKDYSDGRHPGSVEFSDAREDARRRDFTVNGLFYDPIREEIKDWVGGEADLKSKILRTIGTPEERFSEDHLRLLRAVRFAAQLGFEIEPATFAALRAHAGTIGTVSAERVREELLKLFRPPHAGRGLDLLRDSGLLEEVLPEVSATIGCEQSPDFHPEGSVYNHIRLILDSLALESGSTVIWAALLHDIAKPPTASHDPTTGQIHFYGHEKLGAEMAETILRRLKFPRKQIEQITTCVRYHMQFKDVPRMRKSTLRRMLMRPTFPLELELHRLDCLGSHRRLDLYERMAGELRELEKQPAIHPPLISGKDLMKLGIRPGPEMGALLEQIREKQLQDELTTREEALDWVRRVEQEKQPS